MALARYQQPHKEKGTIFITDAFINEETKKERNSDILEMYNYFS